MNDNHQNALKGWAKLLNPEELKQNLLLAGLYLAAFELLKNSLIGRPYDFFWNGFKDGRDLINPDYEKKVLSLHKHRYTASALWFRNFDAIDDTDLDKLREVREHRDDIAHNMPKLIGTMEKSVRIDLLQECHRLLHKIDNWWIVNVEIATDPPKEREYTLEELDEATSLSSMMLSLILPIAFGDDSKLRSLYEMWTAMAKPSNTENT